MPGSALRLGCKLGMVQPIINIEPYKNVGYIGLACGRVFALSLSDQALTTCK